MKKFLMIAAALLATLMLASCGERSISCGGVEGYFETLAQRVSLSEIPTNIGREAQLVFLTEDELFDMGTSDFRGTVTAIDNYEIDFDGEAYYCAVVTFRVDKSLRHDLTDGETITVYVSSPIGTENVFTDNGVACELKVGMEGVFRPVRYGTADFDGANSLLTMNGVTYDKRMIADFGFYDGVRFLYLADENGDLIYDETAFPSLQNPKSLDDIETYVVGNWDWCREE